MLEKFVRQAINTMQPAFGAHGRKKNQMLTRLCDNENPFAGSHKLYPDDIAQNLTRTYLKALDFIDHAEHSNHVFTDTDKLLLTRGASDALDLAFRAFFEPGQDSIAVTPPNFKLFNELATVYNIQVQQINLQGDKFDRLDLTDLMKSQVKAIILCDPNNPIGSSLNPDDVQKLITNFSGLIIIDEAYVEYAKRLSYRYLIHKHPNLLVIRSMSKALGMAALRLGAVFGQAPLINAMRKVRLPFALASPVIAAATNELNNYALLRDQIATFTTERDRFAAALQTCPNIEQVFYDAGFITIKAAYEIAPVLRKAGFEIMANPMGLTGYTRISLGTNTINDQLINALKHYRN